MCDAYIPDGALPAKAERALVRRLTELMIEHDGVDPNNQAIQAVAWVLVHRVENYVGGVAVDVPHYRFVCHLPEGQFNEERRAGLTADITRAVADAEVGQWPDPEQRVWVFSWEVPDGTWGIGGKIHGLPEFAALLSPDLRQPAKVYLAARRAEQARALLEAAGAQAPAG